MKKLLYLALIVIMIIPFTVKADMVKPTVYYNENVKVGDIFEQDIVFGNESYPINNFVIVYDTDYLSIDKNNVKIMYHGVNLIEDDPNVGTIEILGGKITINIPNKPEKDIEAIDWDLGVDATGFYIELQFTTLKAGTTTVLTENSTSFYPSSVNVNISNNSCSSSEDTKEPVVISPNEDNTEKTDTTGAVEEKANSKNNDSSNNVPLYISLGVNALLLGTTVVLLLKRKKKEEPVKTQE